MPTASEVELSLTALIEALAAFPHGSPDQAFIRRYLGTPRPVLGVSAVDLAALARRTRKEHATWDAESWLALLDRLYASATFEERVLAGKLLGELKQVRRALDLARLRAWLAGQTGWAEVDTTCQSGWTPGELLARWDEWEPFLNDLAQDENISLRRASLVLLVAPLRASADERLTNQALANVARLQGEKSPLLVKAISWVLRAMSAQQPDLVRAYLDDHAAELPASAVRETRKKLETGRKTPRKSP